MTLFQLSPQDQLIYNGQIHLFYEDIKSSGGIQQSRVYKRYHDNKRVVFDEDKAVELYGGYAPGGIFFYKLKNIQ